MANMHLNMSLPFISSKLAVEYFFVCSRRSPYAGKVPALKKDSSCT